MEKHPSLQDNATEISNNPADLVHSAYDTVPIDSEIIQQNAFIEGENNSASPQNSVNTILPPPIQDIDPNYHGHHYMVPYPYPYGLYPGAEYISPSLGPTPSSGYPQMYESHHYHPNPNQQHPYHVMSPHYYPQPYHLSPGLSGSSSAPSSPHLPPLSPGLNEGNSSSKVGGNGSGGGPHSRKSSRSSRQPTPPTTTNVYVRGLPPNTTDEALFNMCSAYGTIISSKSILDPRTNLCRGYGFVMYEYLPQAHNAIQCLSTAGFEASFAKVNVQPDFSNSQDSFKNRLKVLQDQTTTNIYISNLPTGYTEKDLEKLFDPYIIVSNRILRDQNHQSRGVGLARMSDRESAVKVIEKFNGYSLVEGANTLQVRFADSPAQKKYKGSTQGHGKKSSRGIQYSPAIYGFDPNNPQFHGHPGGPGYQISPPFYPADGQNYLPVGFIGYPPSHSPYFGVPYSPNFPITYYPYPESHPAHQNGEQTVTSQANLKDQDVEELTDLVDSKLILDDNPDQSQQKVLDSDSELGSKTNQSSQQPV